LYRTEIKATTSFLWGRKLKIPIGNTLIHIQINVSELIMNIIFK